MDDDTPPPPVNAITARALLLGERIETAGLERDDVISTVPLAFRSGAKGAVALFRFGVAVFVNMSPIEEDEVLRRLEGRIVKPLPRREEDSAFIEIAPDKDDHITATGRIAVKELSPERTLLIADALATSLILAHDERDVAAVFDVIEPFATAYARGETPIPCISCNRTVKFRDLLAIARDLGVAALATGHYARRIEGRNGAELHMARDGSRDQSYFLFATTNHAAIDKGCNEFNTNITTSEFIGNGI